MYIPGFQLVTAQSVTASFIGFIDGQETRHDHAQAATQARMTVVAEPLLEGLSENAVDMCQFGRARVTAVAAASL